MIQKITKSIPYHDSWECGCHFFYNNFCCLWIKAFYGSLRKWEDGQDQEWPAINFVDIYLLSRIKGYALFNPDSYQPGTNLQSLVSHGNKNKTSFPKHFYFHLTNNIFTSFFKVKRDLKKRCWLMFAVILKQEHLFNCADSSFIPNSQQLETT